MRAGEEYKKIDWWLIAAYIALTLIGWINIFSAVYDEEHSQIFDITQRYGLQFIWILTAYIIAFLILFIINHKLYSALSWLLYGGSLLLLVAVIFFGIEVNGSHSWFALGPIRFQPAEISKIGTTLMLASVMSRYGFQLKSFRGLSKVALIVLLPMAIIMMQKETGSALVYGAFIFVLYREGLSGWLLLFGLFSIALFLITVAYSPFYSIILLFITTNLARGFLLNYPIKSLLFLSLYTPLMLYSYKIGESGWIARYLELPDEIWLLIVVSPLLLFNLFQNIKRKGAKQGRKLWNISLALLLSLLFIFSVEFLIEKVLKEHQRVRIENLVGINVDLKGAGYNVNQSKIAIGSGGFSGKGFLNGTQTKYNFVPEQSTDFIFCTIGEEWGFLGALVVIALYLFIIIRVINSADKQKDSFNRIFGYSLASIIFMHFFINIGMTMGLVPVIGIPLPFVSYGGSSLWSFTIFLFIFIRLDLDRHR